MQDDAFAEREVLTDEVSRISKLLQTVQKKLTQLEGENARGESLGQSLRDEIEVMTNTQKQLTLQCDQLSRESEQLKGKTITNLELRLHLVRQEARDAERLLKLALGGGNGVGADTPLPPIEPVEPIRLDPTAGKRTPSGAPPGSQKYPSLVNPHVLDVMEVEKSYAPSWVKSASPGRTIADGESFRSKVSDLTSHFSKSPSVRGSPARASDKRADSSMKRSSSSTL